MSGKLSEITQIHTQYNVCLVLWGGGGGGAVPWGISSVPWGMFSTVGDIMMWEYLEYCGGCSVSLEDHEYHGGYLEYHGRIMSTMGIS